MAATQTKSTIEIDTSLYPIVQQYWHSDPTPADLDGYFTQADIIADRAIAEDSFYVVVVVGSLLLSSPTRLKLAQWIDQVPESRRQRALASYVVISNPALRGALTALRWVSRRLDNVYSVATLKEGIERAHEHLLKAATPRKVAK